MPHGGPHGLLDRLVTGLTVPGQAGLLRPEDIAAARRGGLLSAGARLLQAGGAQPQQAGTLANLGAAIEAAQAGGAQAVEQNMALRQIQAQETAAQRELERRLRREEVLEGFAGSDDLEGLFNALLTTGDTEAAKAVSEVLKTRQAAQRRPDLEQGINPETNRNEYFVLDENGQPEFLGVRPADASRRVNFQRGPNVTGPDGLPMATRFDPSSGSLEVIPGARVYSAPNQREEQAEFFTGLIEAEAGEEFFAPFDEKGPSKFTQLGEKFAQFTGITEFAGLEFTDEDFQVMRNASTILTEALLRITTGAQANPSEVIRNIGVLEPQAADTPAVLRKKKRFRITLRRVVRAAQGRAAPGTTGISATDFEALDGMLSEFNLSPETRAAIQQMRSQVLQQQAEVDPDEQALDFEIFGGN